MQTAQSTKSLEARIYAVYSGLTPSERSLADVMLEHQMDLGLYTAGELAQKAGSLRQQRPG